MTKATIPAAYQLQVLAQSGKKVELEAASSTTVGQLRASVLEALGIQPQPSILWYLHYKGEQLNNDAESLANVIGEQKPNQQVTMHLKKQPFAGAPAPAAVSPEPTRTYIEQAVNDLRERAEELAIENISVEGVDVYVTLLARTLNTNLGRDRYTLRLRCDNYNLQPPSTLMVDVASHEESASAWPNVPDGPGAIFRPSPHNLREAFICCPGTREWYRHHGYQGFSGPEHWTLANIVESVHFGLNSIGYRGRC